MQSPVQDGLIEQPHGGAIARPWAPGQSGNPAGKAYGQKALTAALEKVLKERGGPEALATALLSIALDPGNKGAVAAIKEVYLRLEGPADDASDTITREYFTSMVARIVQVIRAELPEPDAERVVLAIRDMLDGSRTVQAEVRQDAEGG